MSGFKEVSIEWQDLVVYGEVDFDEGSTDRESGYPPAWEVVINSIEFGNKALPDLVQDLILASYRFELEELLIEEARD